MSEPRAAGLSPCKQGIRRLVGVPSADPPPPPLGARPVPAGPNGSDRFDGVRIGSRQMGTLGPPSHRESNPWPPGTPGGRLEKALVLSWDPKEKPRTRRRKPRDYGSSGSGRGSWVSLADDLEVTDSPPRSRPRTPKPELKERLRTGEARSGLRPRYASRSETWVHQSPPRFRTELPESLTTVGWTSPLPG